MRKKIYKGLISACAVAVLMAGTFQVFDSKAAGTEGAASNEEAAVAETAIAGVALTLDKYYSGELVYDSEQILELLFAQPIEVTGEETETSDETATEEETVPETEPEVVETAPTYSGLAISQVEKYVNIRTEPHTGAPIVGKLYNHSIAQVIEAVNGEDGVWYYITSGTVTGYVKAEFFVAGEAAEALLPQVASRIGVVNTINLRVRSTPSTADDSNIITKISLGTTVVIAGEEGDFYRIQLDESFFGYIHKDYVDVTYQYKEAISLDEERIQAEREYERQQEEQRREEEARAEESRVAAEAQQAATTVAKITARYVGSQKYAGETLTAADIEVAIHFKDGHVEKNLPGWNCNQCGVPLSAGELRVVVEYQGFSTGFDITVLEGGNGNTAPPAAPTEPPAAQPEAPTEPPVAPTEPPAAPPSSSYDAIRAELRAYALQFVGNPYVYGGTDLLNGTDCSGFTMRIYQHVGIDITRTSRSQAVAGREISINNIQVGDLLFYDTNGTITHVAMYIGNGQIIHAANETLGICIMDAFYRTPCKAVTFLDTP